MIKKTTKSWRYQEIAPSKVLNGIVKNFWVFEYNENCSNKDYLLPSSLGYLFFMKAEESFYTQASETGTKSLISNGFYVGYLSSKVEFLHNQILVVGASIYPIHLSLIFNKSPQDFKHQFVRQEDMKMDDFEHLSVEGILAGMEQLLIGRLEKNPLKEEVIKLYEYLIRSKKYRITIDELANWTGYSSRQLNNLFNKHLGISPKKFIQLMRFNHGLEVLTKRGNHNLTHVAQELGYHDQAHFIHDFKKICGKTPKELIEDTHSLSQNFTLY